MGTDNSHSEYARPGSPAEAIPDHGHTYGATSTGALSSGPSSDDKSDKMPWSERFMEWLRPRLTFSGLAWSLVAAAVFGIMLGFQMDTDTPALASTNPSEPAVVSTLNVTVYQITPEPWHHAYELSTDCGPFTISELTMESAGVDKYDLVAVSRLEDGTTKLEKLDEPFGSTGCAITQRGPRG